MEAVQDVFVVPASSNQERLWILDRFLQTGAAYNVCHAFRIAGPLIDAHLSKALEILAARHESLRTAFRMVGGELRQIISPALSVPLRLVDIRDSGAGHSPALDTCVAEEVRRPFNLAEAPLLRATLMRLGHHEAVLVLVAHHIVVDGWSMRVLLEELSEIYRALASGGAPSLPALAVQYADFAVWERGLIERSAIGPGLAFWRDCLAGDLPPLDLPADRQRPPAPSHRGHARFFRIPGDLTARLNETSRALGGSVFIAALTAFAAVLSRYTGQDDLLIGGPIDNRLRPELETAIGFFANTVVFRTNLAGNPTLRELFGRVRHRALEVYAHQDTPFDHVVRSVQPERAADRNPLFQVALAYQRQPDALLTLPGLDVEPVNVHNGTSKFDLLIELQERSGGIDGMIEISADLFDDAMGDRLQRHFLNALECLVSQPEAHVSDFPMLSAEERDEAIHAWNRHATFPFTASVQERFEQRAADRPDDIAVVCGDTSCSYRELNGRANQLAAHLRASGVEPDDRVAIYVEPSIDLVVGILGIVKSGAAYLPLDSSYPRDRVAFTLGDAAVRAVVTTADLASAIPVDGAVPIVRLDRDRPAIDGLSADNPCLRANPDRTAYVIYTSGSTGRPKGVEITHANLTRLFDATDEWFHFGASDVWTLFHSAAFDFSIWELWG